MEVHADRGPREPAAAEIALVPFGSTVRLSFLRFLLLALGLPAVFLFAHPYHGIYHDAVIYALQALHRLYPLELNGDLFFRYGSQDEFTLFSPLYGPLIKLLGLEPAAWVVARGGVLCTFLAAWLLVRQLMHRDLSWLALALFITIPGIYGAYDVFRYGEDFATPRPLCEALVLGSLSLQVLGRIRLACAGIVLAFLVHPLMAMPGLMLAVFAAVPHRRRIQLSGLLLLAAGVATAVAWLAPIGPLQPIDSLWRDILERRVPYLLVDQWGFDGWQPVLVTFCSIGATLLVLPAGKSRDLALAAAWICALGLSLSLLGSIAKPVALIVQGQPWRWFWIGRAIAVLLLAPSAQLLWQRGNGGRGALALLAAAWFAADDSVGLLSAPLGLLGVFLELRGNQAWSSGVAVGAPLLAGLVVVASWGIDNVIPQSLVAIGVVLVWILFFRSNLRIPQVGVVLATAACLGTEAANASSGAGRNNLQYLSFDAATYSALEPWRTRIPSDQTVFYPRMPIFAELLLHRKSYGGYVGLVFSRQAAISYDVAARNTVRWYATLGERAGNDPAAGAFLLTSKVLAEICRESEVRFVVSRDSLKMPNLVANLAPSWGRLYLYACSDVKSAPY